MNIDFKRILPHVIVIVLFALLTIGFFSPMYQGKELRQSDIDQFKGASKEIVDFREKYNDEPLWTNSMFGGMPAFRISVLYHNNYVKYFNSVLVGAFKGQSGLFFLYMIGFYILMLTLRINPWIGFIGSAAFALCSFYIIVIVAGHNSQAHAVGYMAPVLAGVILAFRGRLLLGTMVTALFLALELYTNHLQVTYYLLLLLMIYGIAELIAAIREGRVPLFLKATGYLIVAALLAIGANAGNLFTTYDYSKQTTRGKSELTIMPDGSPNKEIKTSGLDKDYATAWSYGKGETMSLMIPNFKGGGNSVIGKDKDILADVDPNLKDQVASMDRYWGNQPFTSGPVYVGAIIMFLAVLGLFLVKGPLKWALFAGTLLSIMLGWGRNFMPLTNFFLDHFPAYNKFRVVSMILIVIAEFTIPLLAVLGLNEIVKNRTLLTEKVKIFGNEIAKQKLVIAAFVLTGGICLLFFLAPGFANVQKPGEVAAITKQIQNGNPEASTAQITTYLEDQLLPEVTKARLAILKSDAGRSFAFILVAALLIWFYLRTKLDSRVMLAALGLFIIIDMWNVDTRYISKENYTSKREVANAHPMSAASEHILQDKDPDYRVLNMAVSTFNDASTSYYHKSIGGYHGAKLERYQEMIEFYFSDDINSIYNTLRTTPTDSAIKATLAQQGTLNMLNTRYIIYNESAPPIMNPSALGNAWFVSDLQSVKNANEEIMAVGKIDPAKTAIVNEEFKDQLKDFRPSAGSGTIRLTSYKPNQLIYESNAQGEQLAVFSEVYYPAGWNAYVDGKEVSHFRANYLLRAMRVPSGKHTIEFRFEPSIYHTGETISLASSIILILLVLGVAYTEIRKPGAAQ